MEIFYKGDNMLKIFKVALLSAVVVAGLSANDNLLSKVTNGVVADNATGVKMLSDGEMNQVLGGYYFERKPQFDHRGYMSSVAYKVYEDSGDPKLSVTNGDFVVAKVRIGTNGRKQYYLQLYRGDNQPAGAYAGVGASKILDDMKKMGL